MIFGSANAVGCPYQYPAAIETALKWIANHDMAHMEAGTYEVQGKDLYIMIQDITTQDAEIRRPERHNDYLEGENFVDVAPGCYCIFFSDDIHRPGCAAGEPGNVRKAVAKVKQSLL